MIRFHWMHRFNWKNNRNDLINMSRTLDKHNIYSVLLPYGATGPDYLVHVGEMIESSTKLKFMVALRPYALTPEYAAKIFKTFIKEYDQRVTLNVVAGALSPEEQKFVFKNYPGDINNIDNIDKRIGLAEEWSIKFLDIMLDRKPEMYTIANSPMTLDLGNKYFDYVICNDHRLAYNTENAKGTKVVLIIDPLITDKAGKSNVEYLYQPIDLEKGKGNADVREQHHPISGTYEEVKKQILDISSKYGINDFLFHTDQKDIRKMLKLAKEISRQSLEH